MRRNPLEWRFDTMLRYFYRFMLAMMRYEHAIGRSTGRHPADMAALSIAIRDMERDLQLLEMRNAAT